MQKDKELDMKYKQITDIKSIARKANLSVKFVEEHSDSKLKFTETQRQESLKRIVDQSKTLNTREDQVKQTGLKDST